MSSETKTTATTQNKVNEIDKIRLNLADDWKVLGSVYDLLKNGKAFCVSDAERDAVKVVDFKQPNEMKQLIDLSIDENKTHTIAEIEDLCRLVIKYSVKTNHGRFHNQLFGQMDPFGLMGQWITDALNASAYTYEVGPVFSLMETEIIRTVCQLAGYAEGDGIFSPGGSISNMYGLVLARYSRHPQVKTAGLFGMRPLALFTSEESHYSFVKAAHWLGLGADNCIVVKTNERGQMLTNDLEAKVLKAQESGCEPFFVNATAGTTVLGAFDDLNAIADVCEKYGLWLHVDACLGGSALLSYRNHYLLAGLDRTKSFAWNPHKSLGAPLQCSLFLTRERDLLTRCNSIQVNYLFQQDKFYDVSYDTGNKSIQCGRKIDAFKFWLMLKARGYGSFGRLLDHAIDISKVLVEKIKQRGTERFRLVLEDYQYMNVCFWYIPKALRGLEETPEWRERLYTVAPKIKERMAYSGTVMIGYTPLQYRGLGNFFRMVFTCFPVLEEAELDFILNEIERLGEECEY
ncbi:PREDICTED: cysteine sulfinic acid decarboxylase [Bactrocera latifrons]|uniref:Cysteine sulfinic acid decarboxylase n=2 Tax=Bactrocera latifrons TaxID=174628 RepID=A0A0K8W632_BACLA|nr:PREDICTED: cysteine sulfinic acid decarboxylase [Bactrocera latifrons]